MVEFQIEFKDKENYRQIEERLMYMWGKSIIIYIYIYIYMRISGLQQKFKERKKNISPRTMMKD